MSARETAIFSMIGFGVWLSGAISVRFGGRLMFETGPLALGLSAAGVALGVCLLLRSIMTWRRAPASSSVTVAVTLTLPALFCDVGYLLNFTTLTGLGSGPAVAYAVTILFATGVLFAYALSRAALAGPTT